MNTSIDFNPYIIGSKIYSAVVRYFVFEDQLEIEKFHANFEEYMESLRGLNDRRSFYFKTSELLLSLNNQHTNFYDHKLYSNYLLDKPFVEFIEGKWVVTSDKAELCSLGDELQSVNGMCVEEWFKKVKGCVPAGSEENKAKLLFSVYALLTEIKTLGIKSRSGEVRNISPIINDVVRFSNYECRELDKKTLLLKIRSFSGKSFEESVIEDIKRYDPKHLIIDVRGNKGGSTPNTLLSYLINKPYKDWAFKTPFSLGLSAAYRNLKDDVEQNNPDSELLPELKALAMYGSNCHLYFTPTWIQPEKDTFGGQISVLVDFRTFSAGEDFLLPIKQTKRGVLFGSSSAGSTGESYSADLGNQLYFSVSTKRTLFPDGSQFENVGVEPDVPITTTIDDLLRGHDRILHAAKNSEMD